MENNKTDKKAEKVPVERFRKYGIINCAKCGKWPAAYTALEKTELCEFCLDEAVLNYRIKQLKGEQEF